jgi:ATP:corrinoid adenosyltransferase
MCVVLHVCRCDELTLSKVSYDLLATSMVFKLIPKRLKSESLISKGKKKKKKSMAKI